MILRTFPIEFVRQALEQTLLAKHKKNPNFFGGRNQIAINSYFQQLRNQDEVDRFVECFSDIANQQNRTGLIGNGIILAPENPTITNLYSCMIIPMEWNCSMRLLVENRDQMIVTLNNLIDELKGAKVDIAQLNGTDENGKPYSTPFVVGTIGYNDGAPELRNGDYIGRVVSANETDDLILSLRNKGVTISEDLSWLYCEHESKLKVINIVNEKGEDITDALDTPVSHGTYLEVDILLNDIYRDDQIYSIEANLTIWGEEESITIPLDNGRVVSSRVVNDKTAILVAFELEKDIEEYVDNYVDFDLEDIYVYKKDTTYSFIVDDGTYPEIIFPPEHNSFDKFKLSMSFDSLRRDTPRSLNGKEYINISFGGSATLVNNGVKLGNDLIKIRINKKGIEGQADFTYVDNYYLEPLEMPSGNNINTKINQLVSNNFKSNSHADAISLTLQYSFICDENIDILEQWYKYGRFGIVGITKNDISPNMIYNTREIYSAWGKYTNRDMLTKVVESVDNENTESDVMTLSITMQIQGENH